MRICARPAVVIGIIAAIGCGSDRPKAPHQRLLGATTAKSPPAFVGAEKRNRVVWADAQRFYEQNGYQLVWSDGKRPRRVAESLVRAIQAAADDGLDPSDYDVHSLAFGRESFDPARAHEIDLHFTYGYLKLASHLARGSRSPQEISRTWRAADRGNDLVTNLQTTLKDGDVAEGLQALVPQAPQYHRLRAELAKGRQRGASAAELRTLAINMDRWRWMPDDLGPRYVFVNIPAFHLDVVENSERVLEMRVVTGRKGDPTPVLADRMTHVVFSPFWNIPASIVKEEILPRLNEDPDFLKRQNMEMIGGSDDEDVRFRQRPGPRNALGLVKFMFPNNHNVYLHDTPADSLFNRMRRDFSHGCVRLERPVDLAKYVLRDQPEWTEERITKAMQSGNERTVKLTQPIPVYLAYFTAWEEQGQLQTYPDVYGHDAAHAPQSK